MTATPTPDPVSFEEYDLAYRAFLRCLVDQEVGFIDQGFDPWSGGYRCSTEADDAFEARTGRIPSDECYHRHFAAIDRRWQMQEERDHRDRRWKLAVDFCVEQGVDIPEEVREHRSLGLLRHHASKVVDELTLKRFGLESLDLR